ncbi:MAG: hypothetical protein PHI52_00885 [Bacteroidales bacterium]|nr:hypothetical protein [Bacteroidales bacterium]
MKNYIVNNFKAINYQYAVGQLSICIDLEECSLKAMMFEKYPSISPYTYCANNPMKYIDPTGKTFGDYVDVCGNYLGNDGKLDGKVYLVTDPCDIEIIEENNKVGGTTPKDGVSSAIDLRISSDLRTEMVDEMIKLDGPKNIQEHGGIARRGEDETGKEKDYLDWGKPGPEWKGKGYTATFDYNTCEGKGETLVFFHGHFQGKVGGQGAEQTPGTVDRGNAGMDGRNHALNVVISKEDNNAYIFNSSGYITVSLEVFKSVKNTHTPLSKP